MLSISSIYIHKYQTFCVRYVNAEELRSLYENIPFLGKVIAVNLANNKALILQ